MDKIPASLSVYTKQLLQGQVAQLEAEMANIDLTDGAEAWAAYSRKGQAIADLQILITEVPTLEDA